MTSEREFAVSVVKQLQSAGFQALWAGGCVRDQLLGRQPKDYDVATNATPDQIQKVFGHRRTLAIGAAFGVITVLGGKQAGQVEIATFRRDADYSDGRHPDHVTFSSAEEDAKRRDFTINGLFHDPLTGQDIDYVGGIDDLRLERIRAIGNPHERLAEDKLRMLRAVRFAATFDFAMEAETLAAVQEHAAELTVVSAERIAQELRRMLVHESRRTAVQLLNETGLLPVILPEVAGSDQYQAGAWQTMLAMLDTVTRPAFPVVLALLLRGISQKEDRDQVVAAVCHRWRLSNDETSGTLLCLQHEGVLRTADKQPWPAVQRILIHKRIDELLAYAGAVSEVLDQHLTGVTFCRQRLATPVAQWNPPPLVTGDDLKQAGFTPGPEFRQILEALRDSQLMGQVTSKSQALERARQLISQRPG